MNSKCEICGAIKNLQEHHTTYNPERVITICVDCHNSLHPTHGVGLSKDSRTKRIDADKFTELWNNGESYGNIGRVFGVTAVTAYHWKQKLGLLSRHKKYRLDKLALIKLDNGAMRCPYCNYEWEERVNHVKACPRCKRYLPWRKKEVDF